MANKLVAHMGLPQSIANLFAARNIQTAKDALTLPEFDLLCLLGADRHEVAAAVARISEVACPPHQTALSLWEERMTNQTCGRLRTFLKGLDDALGGGIPSGVLTELVGPSGIGKTQFCLKLALVAALPVDYGGLNGRVIYFDTESKFSSRRVIEIGKHSFPQIFHCDGMVQEMAGRIIVLRKTSFSEITESLQQIKLELLQHEVKLLIIDSMAALNSWENERSNSFNRNQLNCLFSFLKSIAEFSRLPILVTNQVRGRNSDETCHYSFLGRETGSTLEKIGTHQVAALGIEWAHAVTIRLILETHSGQKFIKVAKSPISPPLAFPFTVCSSGITLVSDNGIEMMGQEISAIRCQGHCVLNA